jgi:hypothetical protein
MNAPIEEVNSDKSHLSPGALNLRKFENWIKVRDAAVAADRKLSHK